MIILDIKVRFKNYVDILYLKSQINGVIMANDEIQDELKKIGKKLDDVKKINDAIRNVLLVIVFILICFLFMSFIYFSGHFPPI